MSEAKAITIYVYFSSDYSTSINTFYLVFQTKLLNILSRVQLPFLIMHAPMKFLKTSTFYHWNLYHLIFNLPATYAQRARQLGTLRQGSKGFMIYAYSVNRQLLNTFSSYREAATDFNCSHVSIPSNPFDCYSYSVR